MPVTIKVDSEGVTGSYSLNTETYKLGETTAEQSLYSWSETPEFTGNGKCGLEEEFPITVSFMLDQTPSAMLIFKLEGTNTTVGGLQVEVMDTDTGKTITVNTTQDGRIYIPATMHRYGSLRLIGDAYTFADGTPVAKFNAATSATPSIIYVKSTSMP